MRHLGFSCFGNNSFLYYEHHHDDDNDDDDHDKYTNTFDIDDIDIEYSNKTTTNRTVMEGG